MHPITQNLYLSNKDNIQNPKLLKRYKISGILNVAAEVNIDSPRLFSFHTFIKNVKSLFTLGLNHHTSALRLLKHDIQYQKVGLHDGENPVSKLQQALVTLEDMLANGRRVVVSCRMGRSRGPTIGVLYLCRNHGMTFREACIHVARVHLEMDISPRLLECVRKYYSQLVPPATVSPDLS